MNIFEKQKNNLGIVAALVAGFLFDIFFGNFAQFHFFGFYFICLTMLAFFIKFVVKNYLQVPLQYEF